MALCLWGHPCPKYPLLLPRCPGSVPSEPAGRAALSPIPLPGSINAAGRAPLAAAQSPPGSPSPSQGTGALQCFTSTTSPLPGGLSIPLVQPEQGEEGGSRLHRDPQGHTGTHKATPFPIPALNPCSAPASSAATSSPRSDCSSPQPPSTVVFWCWGRNKQGNKGNYLPFISAVGFAIKQPPVLQCLGVSQHPRTLAMADKKSHPHPCTPGNPKQARPMPDVRSPGSRHRDTETKWAVGKIQMTQPRPVPGWHSGGGTAFLSD